jgi:hypothetical protein
MLKGSPRGSRGWQVSPAHAQALSPFARDGLERVIAIIRRPDDFNAGIRAENVKGKLAHHR